MYQIDQSIINKPCIYYLYKKSEIVYIWETTNIYCRIWQHTKTKDFDWFDFFEFVWSDDERKKHEDFLIRKYKPKLNKQILPNVETIKIEKIREYLRKNYWEKSYLITKSLCFDMRVFLSWDRKWYVRKSNAREFFQKKYWLDLPILF